jgi:tetratricopeptide (TPR) repeat protein
MASIASAVHDTAGTFQLISDAASGERRRRASTGALVLHVIECAVDEAPGYRFLASRAAMEVESLPRGVERSTLRRLLVLAEEGAVGVCGAPLAGVLVDYAYELETTQRLPEADAALALARTVVPDCAEIALHAGRVARKLREPERALALYARAQEPDTAGGSLAQLATIGAAVVSPDPERALGQAIRAAVKARDAEAAAVGLEERARVRRAKGSRREAVRDLCTAALRFQDAVDRARVAHELADVAIAIGDVHTAREALLLAVACGDGPQRDHARSRLHTLARSHGDEVGMRRWRTFGRPSLVSLTTSRASGQRSSAATVLARLREWLAIQAVATA